MTRDEFLSAYVDHLQSIILQLNATKAACDGALEDPNCPDGAEEWIEEHSAQCERYLDLFENECLPKVKAFDGVSTHCRTFQ
jgi:hypothetical protein